MDGCRRQGEGDHISSSFIAMVAAIAALMGRAEAGARCPTCHKELVGPTKRFSHFLVLHAPNDGTDRDEKQERYRLRSALVHGGRMLRLDRARLGWSAVDHSDGQALDHLFRVVRRATINWLWRRNPGEQGREVTTVPNVRKLTSEEVTQLGRRGARVDLAPYLAELSELEIGDRGLIELADGDMVPTVKRRYTMAAKQQGKTLVYKRLRTARASAFSVGGQSSRARAASGWRLW